MDQLHVFACLLVSHAEASWTSFDEEVISEAREAKSKMRETWEVGMEEQTTPSLQAAAEPSSSLLFDPPSVDGWVDLGRE